MPPYAGAPVWLSYAAYVLAGVGAGVNGVLRPAQMAGYGVDRAAIGLTFFTGSAGFALAGLSTGALIGRCGVRIVLAAWILSFASWPVVWLVLAVAALAGRRRCPERRDVGAPAVRDSAGPGPARRLAANHRPDLTR